MLTISVPRLALWCASFGLTTWKLAPMVLTHACTITLWQTDMGVMVCRVYKAYYAFVVISWVCSIATLALDVKAGADTRGRGAYEKMGDSGPKGLRAAPPSRARGEAIDLRHAIAVPRGPLVVGAGRLSGDEGHAGPGCVGV